MVKHQLNDNAGSSKEDSEGAVHDKLLAKVDSSLTLDLDFSDVAELGSPERLEYENQITADFSQTLGIKQDRFIVKAIRAGSIIIDFSILPSQDQSELHAEQAIALLEEQVRDPQSKLYTSPNIKILKAVDATKSLATGALFKKVVTYFIDASSTIAKGMANTMNLLSTLSSKKTEQAVSKHLITGLEGNESEVDAE